MSAPFRITRPGTSLVSSPADKTAEDVKGYADRLVKLIPVEVISLYLVGKGVIGSDQAAQTPLGYWIGWTAFCFVAVIIARVLGTTDRCLSRCQVISGKKNTN